MSAMIPESPRYLFAKKDSEQLTETLTYISKVNNVEDSSENDIRRIVNISLKQNETNENVDDKKYSVFEDLKHPKTLINFLIAILVFVVVSFNYYMLGFYIKYVGGNIYINTILIAVAEVVSYLIAGYVHHILGTRWSIFVCTVFGLIFGIPLLFNLPVWAITITVFIARFGTQ